jgi:hypothetical protein
VATKDTLKYLRRYRSGPTYAHVVGYRPVSLAATNIERLENEFLNGTADAFAADRLLEMITGKESKGGNVTLTIRKQVQESAQGPAGNETPASGARWWRSTRAPGRSWRWCPPRASTPTRW